MPCIFIYRFVFACSVVLVCFRCSYEPHIPQLYIKRWHFNIKVRYTFRHIGNIFYVYFPVFSTGRDIASITHLEIKCLLFCQGSETNVPTYFLSVLNTGHQLSNLRLNVSFFSGVMRQMSPPISCLCWTLISSMLTLQNTLTLKCHFFVVFCTLVKRWNESSYYCDSDMHIS